MADREISALPTSGTLNPSDWFHIKQGSTDVKMNIATVLNSHINSANPHSVTKAQVGLGSVLNVEQLEKAQNLADIPSAATARSNLDVSSTSQVQAAVDAHGDLTNNPHSVTKAQVGLANVENYTTTDDPREDVSTKYATGAAVAALASEFDAMADPLPIGSIVMWSKNAGAIPSGYALCNGQVVGGIVTPDLTGKFIKAGTLANTNTVAGSHTVDHTHSATSQNHQLTVNQIPEHQHLTSWGTTTGDGAYYGYVSKHVFTASKYITGGADFYTSGTGGSEGHNHVVQVDSTTIDNQPEHYVLAFIMRYQ